MNSTRAEKEIISRLAWELIDRLYSKFGGQYWLYNESGEMIPFDADLTSHEWGTKYQELQGAQILDLQGKYAKAEPLYKAGISTYQKCREHLTSETEVLKDVIGESEIDPKEFCNFVESKIDEMIKNAKSELSLVREKLEQGISELTIEQRYIETRDSLRRGKKQLLILAAILILIVATLVAVINIGWVDIALIIFLLVSLLLLFIYYGFGIEATFYGADPEILDLAVRDGYWDDAPGSAFNEGKLAFANDEGIESNPYKNKDNRKANRWKAGWDYASKSRHRFEQG